MVSAGSNYLAKFNTTVIVAKFKPSLFLPTYTNVVPAIHSKYGGEEERDSLG